MTKPEYREYLTAATIELMGFEAILVVFEVEVADQNAECVFVDHLSRMEHALTRAPKRRRRVDARPVACGAGQRLSALVLAA